MPWHGGLQARAGRITRKKRPSRNCLAAHTVTTACSVQCFLYLCAMGNNLACSVIALGEQPCKIWSLTSLNCVWWQ
eukprot:9264354-Alexandrium_andersonii.AAC.1